MVVESEAVDEESWAGWLGLSGMVDERGTGRKW